MYSLEVSIARSDSWDQGLRRDDTIRTCTRVPQLKFQAPPIHLRLAVMLLRDSISDIRLVLVSVASILYLHILCVASAISMPNSVPSGIPKPSTSDDSIHSQAYHRGASFFLISLTYPLANVSFPALLKC